MAGVLWCDSLLTHQDDSVVARGLDERAEPLAGLLIVLLPRRGDGVSWKGREGRGSVILHWLAWRT